MEAQSLNLKTAFKQGILLGTPPHIIQLILHDVHDHQLHFQSCDQNLHPLPTYQTWSTDAQYALKQALRQHPRLQGWDQLDIFVDSEPVLHLQTP